MVDRTDSPGPEDTDRSAMEAPRNRLGGSASLYLRQHARNPVPWWPFGPEAFQEARRRDLPILLSIGYASCHWCHVMERESFEDEEVARVLAEDFVPVKVDREDRPDVDAFYLQAVQAMTGQGGWPLTALLTPDGHPFFGGTYFPRPVFLALLREVSARWRNDRELLVRQGRRVLEALRSLGEPGPGEPGEPAAVREAIGRLPFDRVHGGIGGPVKFPQVPVLDLVLAGVRRDRDPDLARDLERTLRAMITGGIRDVVGGGFHRYATEATWSVPHFEKMLYDNAMLARLFAEATSAIPDGPSWEAVARDTVLWMIREMVRPDGLFASSLDADDPLGEGTFYLWDGLDLKAVLGDQDALMARSLLDDGTGRFHPSFLPTRRGVRTADDEAFLDRIRPALREARSRRPAPVRDSKVVLEWNALACSALVTCGVMAGREDWIAQGDRTARALVGVFRPQGRILGRALNGTEPEGVPTLADAALWALSMIDLHGATGDPVWADLALSLAREIQQRWHAPDGTIHLVPDGTTDLPDRPPLLLQDHPTPSGPGAWIRLLVRLECWTGDSAWTGLLESLVRTFGPAAMAQPQMAPWTLLAMEERTRFWTAVMAGSREDPAALALARTFLGRVGSGGMLVWRDAEGSRDGGGHAPETLRDRPMIDGRPTLYLCHAGACLPPIQDPDAIEAALGGGTLPPDGAR
ncbi:MAG TPA: thioredoxin domain-containing protein [Myxococcota bacterium]|nr:thioredoxin domain-containing protein [Myxococcota bacterium]HQK50475.1 thioredoxin domain-containing protein [Myxococcota bacterium]